MLLQQTTSAQKVSQIHVSSFAAKQTIEYEVVIISDVHFGSPMCQARELDEFLSRIRVRYLILNGDIFDDLKFNRLQHWHWQALGRIRKISDHCKVIWIRGNHDTVSARTMSHLLGVEVKNHFEWSSGDKRFFVVHGDRWDAFIHKHRVFTEFITLLYNCLQKLNGKAARSLAKWLKRRAKLLTRNSESVLRGAISYAKKKRFHAIFCGHTHMPMLTKLHGVIYGNDGTWQSDDPHFIGIEGNRVELCRYIHSTPEIVSRELID